MAVQDLLEMSRDLTPSGVSAADRWLAQRGVARLSEMRAEVWRTIPKVLARGRIRSEEEYYLVIERLNDVDDLDLCERDRRRLELIAASFADRVAVRP